MKAYKMEMVKVTFKLMKLPSTKTSSIRIKILSAIIFTRKTRSKKFKCIYMTIILWWTIALTSLR